ncbi:hypothetical protein CP8484711_0328B, partial [Chlamydia psittaci 84-8471/1]
AFTDDGYCLSIIYNV